MDTQNFGTAAALQKAQAATGKAFMPLEGGYGASSGMNFDDDEEFNLEKKGRKRRFNVK